MQHVCNVKDRQVNGKLISCDSCDDRNVSLGSVSFGHFRISTSEFGCVQ